MKVIRILALTIGATMTLLSVNSCKKDKDSTPSDSDCCTWVDDYGDSYTYCRDNDDWKAWYDSWEDVTDEAAYYGGSCN